MADNEQGFWSRLSTVMTQLFAFMAAAVATRSAILLKDGSRAKASVPFEAFLKKALQDPRFAGFVLVLLFVMFLLFRFGAKVVVKSFALSVKLTIILFAVACVLLGLVLMAM